ncbi:MAG: vWA domain-containing protein [Gaiellaceae bacterium]
MADAVARHVVTFGRVLREAGLEVGPGRLADALTGLDLVNLSRRDDVYWTLRQTLVSRWEDLDAFDAAFAAWFLRAPTAPVFRQGTETTSLRLLRRTSETKRDEAGGGEAKEDQTSLGYSPDELLRRRDFADMTPEELENVGKLICAIASGRPRRKSRRLRPHHRGRDLDMRRLVRASLATGGEAVERAFRSRVHVPRKLVVLCDVSGSMEAYSRALILFLHALARSGRGVETFAFGTRLTRLTREIVIRDPEGALRAAAERVVDWSGGTRIGHSLKTFNDEWGRRALTRGAVVVIVSDGWEREDAAVVGHEMARLARQAYAVVWVNPLKGHPDYQPLAGGMRAALPYVDRFLSGHNLASLEELAEVLTGIERRHAA